MLPAVTRTLTATVTALAIAAGSVAPAQALGRNERNVLKGIAAAVLIHEVVRQSRKANAQPAPAPVQPQRPVQQQPVNAAAAAFHEYDRQGRRLIQQRLAAYGYYHGAIDGLWGRGTAGAVAAYARDVNAGASLHSRDGSVQLYNHLIG